MALCAVHKSFTILVDDVDLPPVLVDVWMFESKSNRKRVSCSVFRLDDQDLGLVAADAVKSKASLGPCSLPYHASSRGGGLNQDWRSISVTKGTSFYRDGGQYAIHQEQEVSYGADEYR